MLLKKKLISAVGTAAILFGVNTAVAQIPAVALPTGTLGGLPAPTGLPELGLPFGVDPFTVGDTFIAIGAGALAGGGLSGVPLIGEELNGLTTPEGAQAGLEMVVSEQKLPVGIPVVGRQPHKLYGPVFIAILRSNGVPVDMLPINPVTFSPGSVLAP